jgi:A/G-specific adenine glycosylase
MDEVTLDEHLPESKVKWFRRGLKAWAEQCLRDFPWRHTTEPYRIFVAEFLLQQTDAPRVVPVYHRFLERYPTIYDLAAAPVDELAEILRPLGFHFRAVHLLTSAGEIVERFEGHIPHTEGELLELHGVGRYVARSVCTNAFAQGLAVLDTNIARILQRFFGLPLSRARARNDPFLWQAAQRVAPKREVGIWNLTLIDFGAAVCTARNPKCSICPVQKRCYHARHSTDAEANALIEPSGP